MCTYSFHRNFDESFFFFFHFGGEKNEDEKCFFEQKIFDSMKNLSFISLDSTHGDPMFEDENMLFTFWIFCSSSYLSSDSHNDESIIDVFNYSGNCCLTAISIELQLLMKTIQMARENSGKKHIFC